jgi:hypothetical protein
MSGKGFHFHSDLGCVISTCGKLVYYYYQIRRRSPLDLLGHLNRRVKGRAPVGPAEGLARLAKRDAIIRHILSQKLKYTRPCLLRCCILYVQATKDGLAPELVIGVKRTLGKLEGHSWILIGDRPFREDGAAIGEYTIMLRS